MKILSLETRPVTPDGFRIVQLEAGKVYDLPPHACRDMFNRKTAVAHLEENAEKTNDRYIEIIDDIMEFGMPQDEEDNLIASLYEFFDMNSVLKELRA